MAQTRVQAGRSEGVQSRGTRHPQTIVAAAAPLGHSPSPPASHATLSTPPARSQAVATLSAAPSQSLPHVHVPEQVGTLATLLGTFAALVGALLNNERRFNRIDLRLEQMQSESNRRFEQMQSENNRRFEQIEQRLEQMQSENNRRFEQMQSENNRRFEQIEHRFEQIEQRLEQMQSENNRRFEQIDKRFENMERRFDQLMEQNEAINESLFGIKPGQKDYSGNVVPEGRRGFFERVQALEDQSQAPA